MELQVFNSSEKYSITNLEGTRKPQKPSAINWEIGQIVDDKYEVLDILVKDTRKIIYKVRHCQWNIPLAVRSQIERESQVGFFHQAERWVELGKHPNIVSAYYVQNLGGMPRLFVEYVTNAKTLQQLVAVPKHDAQTILDIAIQTAWGMQYAHQKGILHGDLRPANVFFTDDGDAKIADFRSREGVALEFTTYMPPEQFEKDTPLQPPVDIYSFGVILYELCTGQQPFPFTESLKTEDAQQKFCSIIVSHPPTSPKDIRPIPDSLSQLILQCLQVNPQERPKDFLDIAEQLKNIYLEVTGFKYPREEPEENALTAVDLNNRALSLLDLHEEEKAEEFLEEAVRVDPQCTGAFINLCLLRLRNGRYGLAQFRKETQRLLELDREVVSFYRTKIALELGGFLAEAGREVDQAAMLFPKNKELHRLRANVYHSLGKYAEASDIVQELCNVEKPLSKDLYCLGCCYSYDGKRKKAQEVWERALSLYKYNVDIRLAQAITSALQGKLEEAYQSMSQIVQQQDHFWALLNLAEITAGFGNYVRTYEKAIPNQEEAKKLYEKLLAKAPDMPRVIHGYLSIFGELVTTTSGNPEGVLPIWSYARSLEEHNQGVNCMALSPDGRTVVAAGGDSKIKVWEVETGKCKSILEGHPEGTTQIVITYDGHFAVTIGRDSTAKVWDLISGECVATLEGHVRDITAAAVTCTGYLVTGSLDKTLRIWDLGSLSCRKILRGHNDKINSVTVTPDGHFALSAGEDGIIGVWDVEQGEPLHFLEGHQEGITCLAMSPTGEWFASASWDQKIRIWNLENGTCLNIIEEHTGTINCLIISSDGSRVISGSEDKTIRVFEAASGTCLHVLKGHKVDVTSLATCAHDTFLVSGSWDHTVRIWHLMSGQCIQILEAHTDLVNLVAVSNDDRFIISGGDDSVLRVWCDLTTLVYPTLSTDKLSYLLQSPRSQQGNFEAQRRVENLMAQADTKAKERKITEAMHIYREVQNIEGFCENTKVLSAIYTTARQGNLQRKKPLAIWQHHVLKGHTQPISCLALNPKEDSLISGSCDSSLRIWNVATGECLQVLTGHAGPITSVDISPNGRFVISASHDKTLRLWELETGRCIHCMEGHELWVEHVLFSPDGRRVISGSRDNSIKIWERKNGHRLYSLNNHSDLISDMKITPDGQYIVSASQDRTLRVWELESGQCQHNLEKHTNHVSCLTCHPNKQQVLSGGWDGIMYLWDIQKGECIAEYHGHQSWINQVLITPDGKLAISTSLDKTIRIWDLQSTQCLQVLRGHTEDIRSVCWLEPSKFMVSASWDKTLRIWDLISGATMNVLDGHTGEITVIQTFQNGQSIASGSRDTNVIVWQIDWDWEQESASSQQL